MGGIGMEFPQIAGYDADVDWLSVTAIGESACAKLETVSQHYMGAAPRVYNWQCAGYRGKKGVELPPSLGGGGIAYGLRLRDDTLSGLLQCWGGVCRKVEHHIGELEEFRWTRVDLAVTVLFKSPIEGVQDWRCLTDDTKRRLLTRITKDNGEGGTLYVGRRGSETFGRVYDKGAQLGTFPLRQYWRWEVENLGQHARQLATALMVSETSADRCAFISGVVGQFFNDAGIPIPSLGVPRAPYPVIQYATRVQSDAITIRWLREQVSPALRRVNGNGKLPEALSALGLEGVDLVRLEDDAVKDGAEYQMCFLDRLQTA